VTLDAGPLKKQVDEVRAFYLAIPDDDLLKGFQTRAGKPAPGKELGGWYSSDTFEPCSQPDRRSTGSSRRSGSTGTTGTSTLGTATSSLPDRMVIAILRTTPTVMSTPWVERGPPIR
jgi:hypothetical protein